MLRTGTSEFTTVVNYFQRFPAKWENVCKSVRHNTKHDRCEFICCQKQHFTWKLLCKPFLKYFVSITTSYTISWLVVVRTMKTLNIRDLLSESLRWVDIGTLTKSRKASLTAKFTWWRTGIYTTLLQYKVDRMVLSIGSIVSNKSSYVQWRLWISGICYQRAFGKMKLKL